MTVHSAAPKPYIIKVLTCCSCLWPHTAHLSCLVPLLPGAAEATLDCRLPIKKTVTVITQGDAR